MQHILTNPGTLNHLEALETCNLCSVQVQTATGAGMHIHRRVELFDEMPKLGYPSECMGHDLSASVVIGGKSYSTSRPSGFWSSLPSSGAPRATGEVIVGWIACLDVEREVHEWQYSGQYIHEGQFESLEATIETRDGEKERDVTA